MKEIDLKISLITFLIENNPSSLLVGAEIRFNFGSRRADVVTLMEGFATVFEIKSATDKIDRLPIQLSSYKDYFDYCYIVCVKENISLVRKVISKNIGIILIDGACVKKIRKSQRFLRHDKLSLASTISTEELKKKVPYVFHKSKFNLCKAVSENYSLNEVRAFSRSYLKNIISERYFLFNNELGKVITPDDLLTITRMPSGLLSKNTS